MKKTLLLINLICFLNLNAQTFNCGDMLIDTRDGNTYQTVLIGSQCWMAENLNLGDMIIHTNNQTNNGQYEKYCPGDSLSNCDTYGGLYQWNETMQYSSASNRGICPNGWHVPSDSEWKELEMALGMSQTQADLDGFRGTDQATQLVLGGTSGFNVLYAGARGGLNISLSGTGDHNLIWSSTIAPNGKPQKRGFYDFEGRVFRGSGSCTCAYDYGYSVRCIQDQSSSLIELKEDFYSFNVYPNPTTQFITLDYTKSAEFVGFDVEILNVMGKNIKKVKVNSPSTSIDIRDFPNGLYLIKVCINDKTEVHQILKQ